MEIDPTFLSSQQNLRTATGEFMPSKVFIFKNIYSEYSFAHLKIIISQFISENIKV